MTQKRPENTITLEQFARHFSEQKSERFCFILGAGASKSSGIPTGAELSSQWLNEIEQDLGEVKFAEWLESENIDKNNPAYYYSKIFGKRFEVSRQGGLDCLETVMRNSDPSCGYSFLAEIMAQGKHNIVITTNFDSLTEDALFIFTSKKPLVVGHSSLSEFINVQSTRPQIIKVHHDLFLSPKNTNSETEEMGGKLKTGLKKIFEHYTPIVIGYGGNDGGFMELLQDGLSEDGRLFWCLMETEESPRKDIEELVISKNGHFVPIDSFDELMVFVGEKMGFKLLHERIETVAKERTTKYKDQFESVRKSIAERKDNLSVKNSLSEIISHIENSPWYFELSAQQETDIKRKEEIYKRGLDKFPETYELISGYAQFLHYTRKSPEAEKYYKKALELEPENATLNGNYANFLLDIKKDSDEAEKYYKKALKLKPEDATINCDYAVFLLDIKKDSDEAEKYYKKALELEPEGASNNGNYALFLLQRGQLKAAKKFIDKAFHYNQLYEQEELKLELWFYRYACFYKDYPESKEQVTRLLNDGIRSPGWNLTDLVEKVKEMHHPEYAQVIKFANQISAI